MKTQEPSTVPEKKLQTPEKKKKNNKATKALVIGFLFGILVMGTAAAIKGKNAIVLLPMLILAVLLYKLSRNSKKNKGLTKKLEERKK